MLQYRYDADGVRHLTELKLYEVSIVTFPMNESATVTAVKQLLAGKAGRTLSAATRDTMATALDHFSKADTHAAASRKHLRAGHAALKDLVESADADPEIDDEVGKALIQINMQLKDMIGAHATEHVTDPDILAALRRNNAALRVALGLR